MQFENYALIRAMASSSINIIIAMIILIMHLAQSHGNADYNGIAIERDLIVPADNFHHQVISGEKRSWQNLQASWGKRDYALSDDDYDINGLTNPDSSNDYDDYFNYQTLGNYFQKFAQQEQQDSQQQQQQPIHNEQKRGWKSMSGAWGKRLESQDWNRFRGSWGKRQPSWNNLKGLWGKRVVQNNWNKLQPAWGKRDLQLN